MVRSSIRQHRSQRERAMTWRPAPRAMVGMQRVFEKRRIRNPVVGGPDIGERPLEHVHKKLTQTSPSLAGRAPLLCASTQFFLETLSSSRWWILRWLHTVQGMRHHKSGAAKTSNNWQPPTSTLPSPTRSPGAQKRSSFTTDFSVHRPPCSKREHVAWSPDVISKPRGILLHEPASPGFKKVQRVQRNATREAIRSTRQNSGSRFAWTMLFHFYHCWDTWGNLLGFVLGSIFLLGGIHKLGVVV